MRPTFGRHKTSIVLIFLTIFWALLITSCQSDDSDSDGDASGDSSGTTTGSLSGYVFHNYDGTGNRGTNDPAIEGVVISIGGKSATTNANGYYEITNLDKGDVSVNITSPNESDRLDMRTNSSGDPIPIYRYYAVFNGWVNIDAYEMNGVSVPAQTLPDTDLYTISTALSTSIEEGSNSLNIALMNGFLTLPYLSSQASEYTLDNPFDLDTSGDSVRWFNDGTSDQIEYNDQHYGLDFAGERGLWVVSWAPCAYSYTHTDDNGGKAVWMNHFDNSFQSNAGHIDEWVIEDSGQKLYRGQIIGINGDTGTQNTHIHAGFYDSNYDSDLIIIPAMDPYRDLQETNFRYEQYDGSRWGKKNYVSIGSPGFWTKNNDPQTAR